MSFLVFFVVTQAAAVGSLATRRLPAVSLAAGLLGLLLALVAAIAISPGERLTLGGTTLTTTAYLRLFLAFGSLAASLVCIVSLATTWQRNIPAATLAVLGWTGLALALPIAATAVIAGLCAGLIGILVTLVAPISARGVDVSVRELRAVVIAGALAIAGFVVVAAPIVAGTPGSDPMTATLVGLAYVAVVVALALRFGVIPFHVWAGRLSQAAPEAALPLLLGWAPAGFAVVALAWVQGAVVPFGAPLGFERALAVAVGATTLLIGTFAVWIQDDLEHIVGYSTVQDAGFIVLGLAILGPEAWEPARTWIIVFGVVKTALAAWALALETTEGGRRLDELDGWVRRSPALGIALLAIVIATIGWPGSPAWVARWELVRLSMSDPLGWIVALGSLSSLAYYGRLAWIGVGRPDSLRRPRPWTGEDVRGRLEAAVARASGRMTNIRRANRPTVAEARGAWTTNRRRTATSLALVLALVSIAAAAGWPGIPEAARADAPTAAAAHAGPDPATPAVRSGADSATSLVPPGAPARLASEAGGAIPSAREGQSAGARAQRSMSRS
jgi:NADH-quinone oxidoreductase subunit N